jgi:hypothetical protein
MNTPENILNLISKLRESLVARSNHYRYQADHYINAADNEQEQADRHQYESDHLRATARQNAGIANSYRMDLDKVTSIQVPEPINTFTPEPVSDYNYTDSLFPVSGTVETKLPTDKDAYVANLLDQFRTMITQ